MADVFTAALADLRDALIAGDALETALADVASDHGVSETALRNRGERAYGDLETYAVRQRETAAAIVQGQAKCEAVRVAKEERAAAAFKDMIRDFARGYDFQTNTFRA